MSYYDSVQKGGFIVKGVLKRVITPLILAGATLISCIPASASDLAEWASGDFTQASSAGLLPQSIVSSNLNGNITREEFCELVVNLYTKIKGDKIQVPENSPFKDTNNDAVKMAYMSGIIAGTSEDTFHPNKPITRQEMAKMLIETMNVSAVNIQYVQDDFSIVKKYPDNSKISGWATRYMAMMVQNGLMNGLDDGTLAPLGNATRQQAIVSVNRCYQRFADTSATRAVPKVLIPKNNEVIKDKEFPVEWQKIDGVVKYHLIVKSPSGLCIFDTAVTKTKFTLDNEIIDGYTKGSITVGAEFEDGTKTFSSPVDFSYTYGTTEEPDKKPNDNVDTSDFNYSQEGVSASASKILKDAESFLGLPYIYGGSTPKGFDCSGFTKYIFNMNGITLHRVSRDQYKYDGTYVKKSELQPGDLVFFGDGGVVGHVGIYAGNGKMIHSPRTGKSICYTSIETKYYVSRYIGAKRVLD